jgi:hypothetical protein
MLRWYCSSCFNIVFCFLYMLHSSCVVFFILIFLSLELFFVLDKRILDVTMCFFSFTILSLLRIATKPIFSFPFFFSTLLPRHFLLFLFFSFSLSPLHFPCFFLLHSSLVIFPPSFLICSWCFFFLDCEKTCLEFLHFLHVLSILWYRFHSFSFFIFLLHFFSLFPLGFFE